MLSSKQKKWDEKLKARQCHNRTGRGWGGGSRRVQRVMANVLISCFFGNPYISPASYITFRDIKISNGFQMELLSAVIHVEQDMRDFDIEQIIT